MEKRSEREEFVVRCKQATLGYRLAAEWLAVLREFDLEVAPGEFVVLLGPSGCGKSSLLRLLMGLERVSTGSVEVRAKRPSLVFQDGGLFPWMSLVENAAFGLEAQGVERRERESRALAMLEKLGLGEYASALPGEVSTGMAQRVALARSFVAESDFLLLDEPFAALDALTRRQLQRELLSLTQQSSCAVLMVTHDVDEALLLGERVVVLTARPSGVVAEYVPQRGDALAQLQLREEILRQLGVDTAIGVRA